MASIRIKEVLETLLPPGSIWDPEKRIVETIYTSELITNGTFDSDLTGWTDSSGANAEIYWEAPGVMVLKAEELP